MDNYEYCAHWVQQQEQKARVLDYGCGAGQAVSLLRNQRIDAFGCDVFYEGGDNSKRIPPGVLPFIRRMEGNVIPFEAASFDIVIANQVFEHVPDLDACLEEIARVLKPGGRLLALFPDRSVWREGHCGVPLLHRFRKGSELRVYYAAAWRLFGFGHSKKNKTVMQWSRDFCVWLDDWTHYRSLAEIHSSFVRWLGAPVHIEDHWLAARAPVLAAIFPRWFQRLAVRKLGGLVFAVDKPVN